MSKKTKEKWYKNQIEIRKKIRNRCFEFEKVINEMRNLGFDVVEISYREYSFNEMINISPGNRTYYDKINNKRGRIDDQDIGVFIRKYFGLIH